MITKIVDAVILHYMSSTKWISLFAAWDTNYYYELAANWYPSTANQLWAFFPLYPASIRSLGFLGLDLWTAGFLISILAGFASILIFQRVARCYLNQEEAIIVTTFYFLLPPVFVFTTVSYTEALFLLLTLITWYSHIRERDIISASFASLVVLTRIYGLLIVVPLAYDFIRRHQLNRVWYLGLPFCALMGWLLYAFERTSNILAPLTAQSYWNTTIVIEVRKRLSAFFTYGDLRGYQFLLRFQILFIIGVVFAALITWLCIRSWKLDRSLGVYSLTFLLAIGSVAVIFIQTFGSLPRFLSMIFPAGLSFQCKKRWLIHLSLSLLVAADLVAWWMFIFTTYFH
jgi:Gpi18-like mannosyltransferase